ncbi:DUF1045 domain-containing protein [Mesorhizobium sp. A623]
MRAAIYFTPSPDAPLTKAAALWLGRDAYVQAPPRAPDPAIDAMVGEPARYGFHATLKAPFRLTEGTNLAMLNDALTAFVAQQESFVLPPLTLSRIGNFFALVPGEPCPPLALLERAALHAFEPFRAPLSEAETARRRPDLLTDRQRRHLGDWGYPYVLDEFRFHMTLTGEIASQDAAGIEARLREQFADFIDAPLTFDGLAIFAEDEAGVPFGIHAWHPLQPTHSSIPTGAA